MPSIHRARIAAPGLAEPGFAGRSDQAISTALGVRIRQLRERDGLTLETLSRRCGVSRAMLSKVERGEKSPTLPIIVRIAGGLGVSLSALLGAEPVPADVDVVRADERLTYRDPRTHFERSVLSPTHLDNGVELVQHRLPAGQTTGDLPPYSVRTQKYVTVIEGRLVVSVDQRPYELAAGDTMYFEVKTPYAFANPDPAKPCTYHMVIVRMR